MARRPCFYFSFRSPYSWLAHHDLITARPEVASMLEWRPFWEPDERSQQMLAEADGRFIYTPMSREKHLYILGDVRRLCKRRGLAVKWPVDRAPCWEASHLAYFVAADKGRGMALIDRIYRARWLEGRDINDPAIVAELAEQVGVSDQAARSAVDDDRMRRRGIEALLAVEEDGVFGVPFFINRNQKFWGVDRLADFLESLDNSPAAWRDAVGSANTFAAIDLRSTDQGHAGGCG